VTELLLPRTDAGALAEAAATVAVGVPVLVAVWRHRELRTFVTGLLVLWVAFMALRTVH